MKTPKNYTDNLKKNIITADMLGDCLVSVDARADNYGEQLYKWRYFFRYYTNVGHIEDSYKEKRAEYFEMKDTLLSLLSPIAIHHQVLSTKKRNASGKYYLCYKVSNKTFRKPLDDDKLVKQFKLPINKIKPINRRSMETNDLISVPFIRKVVALIESGNYTYVAA